MTDKERIMEKKVKFEVGKWYKNLGRNSSENAFGKFLNLRNNNKEFWMSEFIYIGKFQSKQGWLDYSSETVEVDIDEIQQYLPEGHPDKIIYKDFKVGDYVINLNSSMSYRVNELCVVSKTNKTHLACEGKPQNISLMKPFEYFRHATPEEINQHLISIGQIPTGEPLNTGIEPNKDGMFRFNSTTETWTELTSTNHLGAIYQGDIISKPAKPKMILSIDDEELPMVSIIKTNTVKQLLNND